MPRRRQSSMTTLSADTLLQLSLEEVRAAIARGDAQCSDIAQWCQANRQRTEPILQAYHHTDDQQLLAQAQAADLAWQQQKQQALTGLPVSLKAMFAAPGLPCFAGTSRALPDRWQMPGTVVKHLLDNHCPITGLTHAAELAFSGLGINAHWGTPRNPWDAEHHRVPGGSSSGAALSVISGSALFALGTDTGGSVRVPASAAGLVGFKTSTGLWPNDGIVPLSPYYDSIGVITHRVADAQFVYQAIQRGLMRAPVPTAPAHLGAYHVALADEAAMSPLNDTLRSCFDNALTQLCQAGARLRTLPAPLFEDTITLVDAGPNTAAIESSAFIAAEIPDWREHLGPHTDSLITQAEQVSATQYLVRRRDLAHHRLHTEHRLRDLDIVVSPTLTITPPTLDEVTDTSAYQIASGRMLRNTVVANLCGLCAITLPCGRDDNGMPVGLQLMAKNGEEWKLLQFAALAEQCLGSSLDQLGRPPLLASCHGQTPGTR